MVMLFIKIIESRMFQLRIVDKLAIKIVLGNVTNNVSNWFNTTVGITILKRTIQVYRWTDSRQFIQ